MHRIVFLDRSTLDTHLRSASFPHTWRDHATTRPKDVVPRLVDATIAVVNKVKLPRDAIERLPELELVAVAATGVDNVDLDACRAAGIAVCNVPAYAAASVSEYVIASLLALRRNLFGYRAAVQRGAWQRSSIFTAHLLPIEDLAGSTLAIYGHGAIGAATATVARALGMQVILSERKGAETVREGRVSFETALETCDVLSLHCPLTPDNTHLVDADAIVRMKSTAILVNTARGALVDLGALHLALTDGRLGGAVIDVLPHEPPVDGHALLESALPNLVVTPHIAWASREAQHRLAEGLMDGIDAFGEGRLELDLAKGEAVTQSVD